MVTDGRASSCGGSIEMSPEESRVGPAMVAAHLLVTEAEGQ
jgi:hypothetical protein